MSSNQINGSTSVEKHILQNTPNPIGKKKKKKISKSVMRTQSTGAYAATNTEAASGVTNVLNSYKSFEQIPKVIIRSKERKSTEQEDYAQRVQESMQY